MKIFVPSCPNVTKTRSVETGRSNSASKRKKERKNKRLRRCMLNSGTKTDRPSASERRWRLLSRFRETETYSRYD